MGLVESRPPIIKHPHSMVPIMWKSPTKPWFLRGCLILGGRDYVYIYIENHFS